MRIGRLRVVDVSDPADLGDRSDAMRVGTERPQPVAHCGLTHAEGARERGGRQCVRDIVRRIRDDVGGRSELCGGGLPLADEGAVNEETIDNTDLADLWNARREADRPAAFLNLSLAYQLLGCRVRDVVDACDAAILVGLAL